MTATHIITIEVKVTNEDALQRVAAHRALGEGISPEVWKEMRGNAIGEIENDLIMMFDPGVSPPGTQIEHTSARKGSAL